MYHAGAVLVATGYTPFGATRKEEYGYGIYNGVINPHFFMIIFSHLHLFATFVKKFL